jgi:hypothetical protein
VVELSSVADPIHRRTVDGVPVASYPRVAGLPAVGATRFTAAVRPKGGTPGGDPHRHDFLVLTYFEAGGGSVRVNHRTGRPRSGTCS